MKSRRIPAFVLVGLLCLASACELFEAKPTQDMAEEITAKACFFMDELAAARMQDIRSRGTEALLSDSTTPPGARTRSLAMDITEYADLSPSYGQWYSAKSDFLGWSGDGSSPYMELTGTLSYADKRLLDGSRILKGGLDVGNGPEDNSIDRIEFDLTFARETEATGTIKADGTTFTLRDESIPLR
jgi:hypothetical protein